MAETGEWDWQKVERMALEVERLKREVGRLRDAKRRALAVADARSKENVALRAALQKVADRIDSNAGEPLDDAIRIAEAALTSEGPA